MNELLLAETLGHDTTTQLYRDEEGLYRMRVMALPEGGRERTLPSQSPKVFQDELVTLEEARTLFGISTAKRYVEAFPEGQ